MAHWYTAARRVRQDKERKIRLLTKAQKANVLEAIEDIMRQSTWNKRFGAVARMKAELR